MFFFKKKPTVQVIIFAGLDRSEQAFEPLVPVVITFYRRSVADKRVEHHCGIHEGIITSGSFLELYERLRLRSCDTTFSYPDPFTMDAVCAIAVYRNFSICTGNGHPAFFFIPLEWQSLHEKKVFWLLFHSIDILFYIGKKEILNRNNLYRWVSYM
jgi:hypothetical protein